MFTQFSASSNSLKTYTKISSKLTFNEVVMEFQHADPGPTCAMRCMMQDGCRVFHSKGKSCYISTDFVPLSTLRATAGFIFVGE